MEKTSRGLIGGLDFLGLTGVGMGVKEGLTIPSLTFMIFQAMFAIITVSLITGSYVERIKFSSFLVFSLAWATLVYDPVAHWVWGGGWLQQMGVLDFAGGIVVHITAGVSAMAVAMVIGVRKGFGTDPMEPHNIPTTVMGAALLWFGWFGFNAGSALAANGIAANAFVTTNTSAAAAATTWMLLSWRQRAPSALGIVTGAVAGLAAITPAAGFVTPLAAIPIGIVAAIAGYYAIILVRGSKQGGRLAGRSGLPRHRQHLGRSGYGHLRHHRRDGPPGWKLPSGDGAGHGHCSHLGLLLCRHLRPGQDHRCRHGPAGAG